MCRPVSTPSASISCMKEVPTPSSPSIRTVVCAWVELRSLPRRYGTLPRQGTRCRSCRSVRMVARQTVTLAHAWRGPLPIVFAWCNGTLASTTTLLPPTASSRCGCTRVVMSSNSATVRVRHQEEVRRTSSWPSVVPPAPTSSTCAQDQLEV